MLLKNQKWIASKTVPLQRNLTEIALFCGKVLWGEEDTVGGCRRKVETFVEKTKSCSTQILTTGQSGSCALLFSFWQNFACCWIVIWREVWELLKLCLLSVPGNGKLRREVLVMFSVERRNFNGQFFRFLWPTEISSKISNTPQQTETITVG